MQLDKEKYKKINLIRPLIIDTLKNQSNICSKSAFQSILKKQNETIEDLNQDKDKEKSNDILSKVTPFTDILQDNDLIILNERDDKLTIISPLAKENYFYYSLNDDKKEEEKKERVRGVSQFLVYQENNVMNY